MKNVTQNLNEQIKKDYIFTQMCTDIVGQDKYFCNCGNVINKSPDDGFEIQISYEDYLKMDYIDTAKLTRRVNVKCQNCGLDYSKSEVYSRIFNVDQKFLEKFYILENSKYLSLYKYRFYAKEQINGKIKVENEHTVLSVSKKNKEEKIYHKQFDKSDFEKVDLSQVVQVINSFFERGEEVEMTEDFIYVHEFIGRLGKYVSDSDNINIINGLLDNIKQTAGIEILKKIIASFFGILCYPNLSTLAINKGPKFLFDLMYNCPLPSTKFMKKSGATSPLKIFNFLIDLKNKQLQNKLDEDDVNKLGYKYINEGGKEFYIKYDINRFNDNNVGNVSKNATKVFVRDEIKERQISPFIFNVIKEFSDYENLIKFLRFVTYEQLINLCMNHDKDFLIELYKLIEFREEMNYERIIQFSNLIQDFCKTIDVNKEEKVNVEDVKKYDFNIYDDCQRMLVELKWDFEKVFFKIRKHSKLLTFHDDLVKHRSFLNDKDLNLKYAEFSNKFKYLEEYTGPLKIKVIDTPDKLVLKAKEMKNCAASYVRRVSLGEYIAFNVYDNNTKRNFEDFYEYMMILELGKYGLEFIGVKGPCNIYGPDRFKKDVIDFLEKNDIAYKEVPSIKLGVSNEKNN